MVRGRLYENKLMVAIDISQVAKINYNVLEQYDIQLNFPCVDSSSWDSLKNVPIKGDVVISYAAQTVHVRTYMCTMP